MPSDISFSCKTLLLVGQPYSLVITLNKFMPAVSLKILAIMNVIDFI